jgi:hypothetical protein
MLKVQTPQKGKFLPDNGKSIGTPPVLTPEEQARAHFEASITKFPAAKKELFRILRWCDFDVDHSFIFNGSAKEAEKFVNNMRTCLSRLRHEALEKNVVLQKFTIRLMGINPTADKDKYLITLRKTKSMDQGMSEALSLVFSNIAIEEPK